MKYVFKTSCMCKKYTREENVCDIVRVKNMKIR